MKFLRVLGRGAKGVAKTAAIGGVIVVHAFLNLVGDLIGIIDR